MPLRRLRRALRPGPVSALEGVTALETKERWEEPALSVKELTSRRTVACL